MRLITLLPILFLGACDSLIATFEEDTFGSRPATRPAGSPDDQISLNFDFQGQVVGNRFISLPRSRGQKALEVSGNSVVTFRSDTIPEGQSTGRHTISFFYLDETARAKTIRVSAGQAGAVSFLLEDDTLTISGENRTDQQTFPLRTLGRGARVQIVVDPSRDVITVVWSTNEDQIVWQTAIDADDVRLSQFALTFRFIGGGQFPRGRITVDDVRAVWSPRISFGSPS